MSAPMIEHRAVVQSVDGGQASPRTPRITYGGVRVREG